MDPRCLANSDETLPNMLKVCLNVAGEALILPDVDLTLPGAHDYTYRQIAPVINSGVKLSGYSSNVTASSET